MKRLALAALIPTFLLFTAIGLSAPRARHADTWLPAITPATGGSVPKHIETWTFDDGCSGGRGASTALVHGWVTYAENDCGPSDTKARYDCHAHGVTYCIDVNYLDPELTFGNIPRLPPVTHENWLLHAPGFTDSAHRLHIRGSYLLNDSRPAVDAWLQRYVRKHFNRYDALLVDEIAPNPSAQFFGTGFGSSNEIRSRAGVLAAHRDVAAALTHSNGAPYLQIDNGININPYLPTTFPLLSSRRGLEGLDADGSPMDNGVLVSFYAALLDDMAYVDHRANDFMVLLSYGRGGDLRARRVHTATVLLGYSPGHTVSWPALALNSSHLEIWPEEGIYPTQAVQTMAPPGGRGCLAGTGRVCSRGGHNDLSVAGGVYRREFRLCFNRGVAFGDCGVIVNTNSHPVKVKASWLALSYGHQVTMQGGEVQTGGRINVTGARFTAGSTVIGPHDAILLSR